MIAGLPGTGIGGLFYMLIALWMPVNEVINIVLGRANSKNTQLVKATYSSPYASSQLLSQRGG